jgi:hypothetical protein
MQRFLNSVKGLGDDREKLGLSRPLFILGQCFGGGDCAQYFANKTRLPVKASTGIVFSDGNLPYPNADAAFGARIQTYLPQK